ncbi:uncharacterized protein LOC117106594 [Anneissia japonica]|uniref:uncharacterized protein LOC117106594 n=1 Tax=Anneissia japonica TaxID=1529436 RepID=UPI00142558A0|nr:uncharacterized protein LOC117106594 [Anneissia japonica]
MDCNKQNNTVMEYFTGFDDCILSNVKYIMGLQTKIEYFEERNYIGIAKIESTNGSQWMNNSLQLADDTKVEFGLQLQTEIKGGFLLVAAFTNHTIEINKAINESVVNAGM